MRYKKYMYPIYFLAMALLATAVHLARIKNRTKTKSLEVLLMYLIVFNFGIQGVFAFMGHAFMANEVAEQIGWPTGSPFQFEVAVANLGMGVAAIMSIFWRGRYWLGPVITSSLFIFGDAYGHFVQLAKGDTSPYNAGIFLWVGDIFIPGLIVLLTFWYYITVLRTEKKA